MPINSLEFTKISLKLKERTKPFQTAPGGKDEEKIGNRILLLRASRLDRFAEIDNQLGYGRRHALPTWPEFVAKSCFHNEAFYTHHRPTSTAFELPLSGELLLEHGGEKITVRPGELYILPAGEPNTIRAGKAKECWKISAGFCGQLVAPALATLGLSGERNLIRLAEPAADSRPARTDVPAAPGTGTGIGCGTGRPRAATVHRSRSSDGGAAPSPAGRRGPHFRIQSLRSHHAPGGRGRSSN